MLKITQWDFPGGPVVKTSFFQCRGPRFDPWVRKIPWKKEIPCTEEPDGLQSMQSKRVRHDLATKQQQREDNNECFNLTGPWGIHKCLAREERQSLGYNFMSLNFMLEVKTTKAF